jgi:hypothetical protein
MAVALVNDTLETPIEEVVESKESSQFGYRAFLIYLSSIVKD